MFERLRSGAADALMIVAQRLSSEPRHPDLSRVPPTVSTLAGVPITPDTAVTVPAVWACLRYLSQTVAVPPWHVMRKVDSGAEIQNANHVDWMLSKRPNDEWSSFQFRETLTHWALRWGNGYAEIEPDAIGRPFRMWPVHPDRVDVCRSQDAGFDSYGTAIAAGELFYEIRNGAEGKTTLAASRMFHIRGFGEGPVGVNVIHYAAQSIGWARAAQLFGASFFGNGATPAVVVLNKTPISPDGLRRQREEFRRLYGGVRNAHRTAHLDANAAIEKITVEPEKSQLLETHQFLVEEICRWFGVPPHKVMHLLRATFSNIEHQSIEVVVDSISPWAKRFEDEADYKLFGQNRRSLYTKMNMNALLRGDMRARMEFYKGMREVGAFTPNIILGFEDMNGIGPEGDIHVMQQQYVPLEFIAQGPVQQQSATPASADAGNPGADQAARVSRSIGRMLDKIRKDLGLVAEHV